ncbi:MAG: hypothetical protein R3B45_02850 [Bdellovibrionota bacterium]
MFKIKKTNIFIILNLFLVPYSKICKARENNLIFPQKNHSIETLHPSILSLYVDKNNIYMVPKNQKYIIQTPFNSEGVDRLQKFGALTASQRISMDKRMQKYPWHGIYKTEQDFLLIINGKELSIASLNKDRQLDTMRDVIYDRPLPAADSRGEPPRLEITEAQSFIKKQIKKSNSIIISGIVKIPNSWKTQKGKNLYFAATSIKKYPIIQLSCEQYDPANCKISRLCNTESKKSINFSTTVGIAVKEKTKEILLGDSKMHQINIFKYSSCFHIRYLNSLKLPKKIKKISNIFVDSENNLWVSSLYKDDYFNASIFYWENGKW